MGRRYATAKHLARRLLHSRLNLPRYGSPMDDGFHVSGLEGMDPHDDPRAVRAWRWLHWALLAFSLLAIPAFYVQLTVGPSLFRDIGRILYSCMFAGFTASLAWATHLSRRPTQFLLRNRYDVAILLGSAASVAWGTPPWSSMEWVLRISFMGFVAMRIVLSLHRFFSPNRLLLLFLTGAVLLAAAGGGFYLLEPRVHTYAEGVWLAFESSATVGYGDIAPTTPASRIFAAFVILLGYGILSLVFASIAAIFVGQEERVLRREMHRDIKHLHKEIVALRENVQALRETHYRDSNDDQSVATRLPNGPSSD